MHLLYNGLHIGRSRSSKVVDFGTNRKGVCDFLLVINSNFGPTLHRFWDTASYWLKIANFSYPTLIFSPRSGWTLSNFWMKLIEQKLEGWGTVWWKLQDPNFNRFCMNHPCDRQTDGQTDGIAIAYARFSIYAVARKKWMRSWTDGQETSFSWFKAGYAVINSCDSTTIRLRSDYDPTMTYRARFDASKNEREFFVVVVS